MNIPKFIYLLAVSTLGLWSTFFLNHQFSSVQLLGHIWLFASPWTQHAGFPVLHHLPAFTQTPVHWAGDTAPPHPQPLSSSLQSLPASVFSNESALHIRWPNYWSFRIHPSSEYSSLISFRIDWFDLLAVQGTLNHLLQDHSSKGSILQCSAFLMVQLSSMFDCCRKT